MNFFFFFIFFQSTHQVGMKNVVKCYKDFFGYFNALKTHSELILVSFLQNHDSLQTSLFIQIGHMISNQYDYEYDYGYDDDVDKEKGTTPKVSNKMIQ